MSRRYSEHDDETSILESSTSSLNIESTMSSGNGLNWVLGSFIIVNAAVGAGLLNIGKAYDDGGGLISSSIVHVLTVACVLSTLWYLALCSELRISSYEEFVYFHCGKLWSILCQICICLYMYATCIMILMVMADQIDRCFYLYYGKLSILWFAQRQYYLPIVSVLLIMPLCYSKSIDFLRWPSLIGLVSAFYLVGFTVAMYIANDDQPVEIKYRPEPWTNAFMVLPALCFSYHCHVNATPVFIRIRERYDAIKCAILAMTICCIIYFVVATFSYLTFGVEINHDYLTGYDPKNPAVLTAVIAITVKSLVGYPVNMFCGRLVIENTLMKYPFWRARSDAFRSLLSTIWFASSLILAICIPNITIIIHYLGVLAIAFMFIFPGLAIFFKFVTTNLDGVYLKIFLGFGIFHTLLGTFLIGVVIARCFINDFISSVS